MQGLNGIFELWMSCVGWAGVCVCGGGVGGWGVQVGGDSVKKE